MDDQWETELRLVQFNEKGTKRKAMKVQMILYASLAHLLPADRVGNSCVIETANGSTIRDLMNMMNVPRDQTKVIFLNGRHAGEDQVVREGDRVAVFPPVAGG